MKELTKTEKEKIEREKKKQEKEQKEIERLKKLKEHEDELHKKGKKLIIGIDEAGRGPLAGPVSVGAVIMKEDSLLEWVNDSKKVTEKRREILYDKIIEDSVAWSVQLISNEQIDAINILNATKLGLNFAIKDIIKQLEGEIPDFVIVDALKNIDTCGIPYESIIKGDSKCYSISCASILAKVTRDRLMREYNEVYPEYDFLDNKGYGTRNHIEALKKYGPCPIHRRSFITHFI